MADDIFCRCGARMTPKVLSKIIDYHCPKIKWYNILPFIRHSANKAFLVNFNKIKYENSKT